jgi:hypothetical protein
VIRIRYEDFSAGRHDVVGLQGRVERGARGATVYLLPGLTPCQRRAVIRRLRQEASRGFGPALPLPQLAIALGFDRVRAAARTLAAIVRLHPAVTLVPSAFVLVLVTLFVMAGTEPGSAQHAVSVQAHEKQSEAKPPAPLSVRLGAWYACPQAARAVPRPHDGQLACRRPAPHTAHRPGPLDFAW